MEQEVPATVKPKGFTIDRVSGVVLILIGLFVTWERRTLPLGTAGNPGPGYFPLLLAILLILFGTIMVLRGNHGRLFSTLTWSEAPHAIPILGCCIFIALFMERIGYRITLLLVLGFLFGIIERISVWLVLLLTIVLSAGSFWLFDNLLRVPLPRGWWCF
jgi:putative tricarboxylic transport membrane protein